MFSIKRRHSFPIGLHLEPRSMTLVQLAGNPEQPEIQALAWAALPDPYQIPPEDYDVELSASLRRLIADHGFKGRQVVSCLGSRELFVQNVRLPQLPPDEIEKVVCWEAEERLPYPTAEAEIRHLLAGEVRQDAGTKQEVILLASHRPQVDRHIRVLEQAGLVPVAIDAEPSAVLRSLRSHHSGGESRCAYLNLTEEATTVIFAEHDQILFLKYIASGGRHLDEALGKHLELDLDEASRMRAVVTGSDELNDDDEIHRSVIEAIRTPLETMAAEIELCLRYYKVTFRGKPLEKIIVTGEEASPWLLEFLADRLEAPCEIGNPFQAVASSAASMRPAERPWRWATAIGLSLRI